MQPEQIAENIARVRETMAAACAKAGRSPDSVTLVAVSKTHPPEMILAAMAAGLQHFGENRVEEATEKIPAVNARTETPPVWHIIGHIQRRKAKLVPPLFQVVHSVDSLKLAERLSSFSVEADSTLEVLLEMNVSGEASKEGFPAFDRHHSAVKTALWQAVEAILALPGLQVRGLMTMAPFYEDPEQTRPVFVELARLRDELSTAFNVPLPELSMGMTNDYPVAIEEGATLIRVGRAIFGERAG